MNEKEQEIGIKVGNMKRSELLERELPESYKQRNNRN
jgi:hypothetical protein